MNDDEFQSRLKEIYQPPKNKFVEIDMPDVRYLAIDGEGDPQKTGIDHAMQWLWSVVHFLTPIAKEHLGKNFAYPPLQCLFWSKNPKDFVMGNRDKWQWRVMVVLATWMTEEIANTAIKQAKEKRGEAIPKGMGIQHLQEGRCIQYLHVGDYDGVNKVCEQLYGRYLPENGLSPNGAYHEIYLNDPNRTDPKKRKILIRQPVKPLK